MSSHSLFKVQSLVAIMLFTGAMSFGNFAYSTISVAGPASPEKPPLKDAIDHASGSTDFMKSFSSLLSNQNTDPCTSQNQRVDSLSQQQSSAQTALLDAQEKSSMDQLEGHQLAQQKALDQVNATNAYQTQQRTIAAQLTVDTNAAQSKGAKALQAIRSQVLEMQSKINEAKEKLQAASDNIVNTGADMEANCRAAADDAGTKKKTEIDKLFDASKAAGVKINSALNTLAGADNRRKARRLADIQDEYMTAYKNCMGGTSAIGAAQVSAKSKAQVAFQSAQLAYTNTLSLIATMQANLKEDLAQAQKESYDDVSKAQLAAATALDKLTTAYTAQISGDQLAAQQSLDKANLAGSFAQQRIQQGMTQLKSGNVNLMKASYSADACGFKYTSDIAQLKALKAECAEPPPTEDVTGKGGHCPNSESVAPVNDPTNSEKSAGSAT